MTGTTSVDHYTAPHYATSALLLIDVQNDFLDDGPAPIPGTRDIVPDLAVLAESFRYHGRPVVHVVRRYVAPDIDSVRRAAVEAGARIVAPGTEGAAIPNDVLPAAGAGRIDEDALLAGDMVRVGPVEYVMWKPRWSAFHRTPLEAELARLGVDTVVIAGCNMPNCPRATAFDATARDLRTVVVADAVSRFAPHHHDELASIGVVLIHLPKLLDMLDADPFPT